MGKSRFKKAIGIYVSIAVLSIVSGIILQWQFPNDYSFPKFSLIMFGAMGILTLPELIIKK